MKFQRSETTDRLIRFLRSHEKKTLLPYRELSEQAGEKITSRSAKLRTAINVLEKNDAQVWRLIGPHVGAYRLDDAEIALRLRSWWLRGARRKLIRGGDQSEVVITAELDTDQQSGFAVDCIQRELAFQSLSRATRNKLAKTARGTSNDLPSFNILEWAVSLSRVPSS
jgi:hypothetical protein